MGTERKTLLPSAREKLGEPLRRGANQCAFSVFPLLPTTVTVYVYASHCGVI